MSGHTQARRSDADPGRTTRRPGVGFGNSLCGTRAYVGRDPPADSDDRRSPAGRLAAANLNSVFAAGRDQPNGLSRVLQLRPGTGRPDTTVTVRRRGRAVDCGPSQGSVTSRLIAFGRPAGQAGQALSSSAAGRARGIFQVQRLGRLLAFNS